jgi:hypothetical protein
MLIRRTEFTGKSAEVPVPASMSGDTGEMQDDSANPTARKEYEMGFHVR